jgi:hypothetical protein
MITSAKNDDEVRRVTEGKKNRPRGRPPVPAAQKKVRNFTFRSRGDMHERLSEAAEANGRSISEEIERRLERSFFSDEIEQGPKAAQGKAAEILLHLMTVRNSDTADLLNKVLYEAQLDPHWNASSESRARFAANVTAYICPQFPEGDRP